MKKKKTVINPKPNPAGVMRNDLPGYVKVLGNKLYIRYKGKDISTGFPNTKAGWELANEWWAVRSKELQAIEIGEKAAEDSIENVFKKFLEYKQKIDKITNKTLQYYITGCKAVFG